MVLLEISPSIFFRALVPKRRTKSKIHTLLNYLRSEKENGEINGTFDGKKDGLCAFNCTPAGCGSDVRDS